ncbi:hypothetical protein M407DRAFT_199123 [Tulasnella calospora MUT 4182]|uniref:Uncharacterized protein n=1 Tax=Tulasnella calospora MUT 4182 TaxID=1051891 RepID=A0A0C3QL36_9AGAM|nr:hypothetical protein M407DRAFT_199123 [Tulasnella calospora MUT 4182]
MPCFPSCSCAHAFPPIPVLTTGENLMLYLYHALLYASHFLHHDFFSLLHLQYSFSMLFLGLSCSISLLSSLHPPLLPFSSTFFSSSSFTVEYAGNITRFSLEQSAPVARSLSCSRQ